jgi:hypothetical protein
MRLAIAVASLGPINMASLKAQNDGSGVSGNSAVVDLTTGATGSGSVVGSGTQELEDANPFKRSSKLASSPSKTVPPGIEETPKGKGPTTRKTIAQITLEIRESDELLGLSALGRATWLASKLSQFIHGKANVHKEVHALVTELERAIIDTDKEWTIREESIKSQAEKSSAANPPNRGKTAKRNRTSPQTSPPPSTGKRIRGNEPLPPKRDKGGPWQFAGSKKGKSDRKSEKPKVPKEKPKGIRPKADALIVGASNDKSYADILKKIKGDPMLKELGSNVAKIRRTQKGEMLFELRNDASARSVAYQGMLEEVLGGDAKVRALTQEIVVECRNIDEVTTEMELREALQEQVPLGNSCQASVIKLRKAYAGTQIATIKLPVAEANKLLEAGKIKVGWTICPLRVPERQPLRCFKCLGFGHKAGSCTGTDRSGRCFRCGDAGHLSKDCRGKPKCMLCQGSDNNHATGSFRCKAYLEAKAHGGWK